MSADMRTNYARFLASYPAMETNVDTGGGCKAWRLPIGKKRFALLTCVDDPSVPLPTDKKIALSFWTYAKDGDWLCDDENNPTQHVTWKRAQELLDMELVRFCERVAPEIAVNSEAYETMNSHKPRGRGQWIFLLGKRTYKRTKNGVSITTTPLMPWFADLGTSYRAACKALDLYCDTAAIQERYNYAELLVIPDVRRVATSLKTTVESVGKQYAKNATQLRKQAKKAATTTRGVWDGRTRAEWDARAMVYENAAHAAEKIAGGGK